MLPGETVGTDGVVCDHDFASGIEPSTLTLKVCMSAAGYYLGYECPHCGPYSRETGYWKTRDAAEKALASGRYLPRV